MSKDIKKALEHCIELNCADCPNREELGSGETVCRGRLLPYVLEYVADLETKLADLQQEQIAEMQEHQEAMKLADKTITNLVEDNRASQEWYKKQLAESESRFQAHKQNDARIIQDQTDLIENLRQQLADTETQNKRVLEKLELIVRANQELEQKIAESEKNVEFYKERYSDATTSAYGADLMAKDYQWHLEKEIHELQQSQNQTAIAELEKLKEFAEKNKFVVSDYHNLDLAELNYGICFETLCKQTDQQIKQLKEMKWYE